MSSFSLIKRWGLAGLLMCSCAFSQNGFSEIVVKDFLGRTVKLDQPAKRIVGLAPHIVENIFSAGAGEKIVGAVDYCDYPEAANSIPRVGASYAYSLEKIVSLKPDLVVVWPSGYGEKVLEKLVSLGVNVYASKPQVLEDVAKSIRDFGRLAGTFDVANKNAGAFESSLQKLRIRYATQTPVKTLYQVWNDPIQTVNGQHVISDVIRMCGGLNVFEDAIEIAPKISIESVIAQNPLAIIASGMQEERPDWLDDWLKWKSIDAVTKKNLFFVPPDLIQRHTMRLVQGGRIICEQLDSAREQ